MDTFIGTNTALEGSIQTDRSLTVEGRVEGRIEAKDQVVIGNEGKIEADIYATSVVVGGQINGNVNARGRVEITATGRVTGDISSPTATIAAGGRVDGLLKMQQEVAPEHTDLHRLIAINAKDQKKSGTGLHGSYLKS
jgi:cytoskeletal protein CcmA (bactofilin family)